MASDGTPAMADVLDALRHPAWHGPQREYFSPHYIGGPHWCPISAYPHPACGFNCGCTGCKTPEQYEAWHRAAYPTSYEERSMTMPTDPDAQNPDDTSGTADGGAGLQGDIATDSDDE